MTLIRKGRKREIFYFVFFLRQRKIFNHLSITAPYFDVYHLLAKLV